MNKILNVIIISSVVAISPIFYKDYLNYKPGDVIEKTIIATQRIVVEKSPERLRQDSMDIINYSPAVYVKREFIDSLNILIDNLSKRMPGLNTAYLRRRALELLQRGIVDIKYPGPILIYQDGNYIPAFGGNFPSIEEICKENDTLCLILFPTLTYDSTLTYEYMNSRLKSISKVDFVINPGEVVVSKGEIVNDTTLRILEAYKKTNITPKKWAFLGLCLLISVFIFMGFYVRRWDAPSFASVFIFSTVYLSELAIHRFTPVPIYFTLSPIISLTVSSLDTPTMGISLALILAVIRGANYDFGLTIPLYLASMAITSSMGIKIFKRRIHTLYIVVITFISGMVSLLISTPFMQTEGNLLNMAVWCGLSSFISTSLYFITLPVIERVFRRTTEFSLIELTSLDHPLLKELSSKAPGTFAHSISVGHLAEAAARAVGANHILAKVGGYYHDIGKIFNPEYFIENQIDENPHDNLDPITSAKIIISHVKKGVELARKHNLPEEVVNIIASHHGTTLLKPFYLRAKSSKLPYSEEQFRYPGPKPRTPEEGIVMLADSVEAASRGAHTEEEIREMVDRVFNEKINDGQLDWVPLSRRDLQKIKDAFIPILLAYRHTRPKYPIKKDEDEG